ncbi:MAG: ABC transporter ATP-binding protein [Ardenticatenaceae bacterium]|nr:ABC transporter ATP-binding protein [Ardenticatenaceae bacterium]
MADRLPAHATWPLTELYRCLQTLSLAAGYPLAPAGEATPSGPKAKNRIRLDRWMRAAGQAIQVAAEPVTLPVQAFGEAIGASAPLLLHLPGTDAAAEPEFLAILSVSDTKAVVIDTHGQPLQVPLKTITSHCLGQAEQERHAELHRAVLSINPRADETHLNRLLENQEGQRPVAFGWHIRLPADTSIRHAIRQQKLTGAVWGFVIAHGAAHGVWLAGWFWLGKAILTGTFSLGWFFAWALARLTLIPLRAMSEWFQGRFSIGLGAIIKRRLLAGAFNLDGDQIKQQGIGQLIGRVLESEAVENLLLQGGFLLLSGTIEICFAFWILSQTGDPGFLLGLLVLWLITMGVLSGFYYRARHRWTVHRLGLTHDLTEKMSGHQTRLAQLAKSRWHEAEDEQLAAYGEAILGMDRWFAWLQPLIVYGWLISAALVLFGNLSFYVNQQPLMAATIGGILATAIALSKQIRGISQLIDAWIASTHIREFLTQAAPQPSPPVPTAAEGEFPLLTTHQLNFRYRPNGPPVIKNLDLNLFTGDRVLLESRSGGGKSTLVSLLAGLRRPQSGLVLLNGLDLQTVGRESWRQQIAIAPQFHENHIFLGTLAFNLLLGRRWPATGEDLAEAEALCAAIGLQPLLNRMPSGMQQVIGETGWKLSHGERTRIYLARALLQNAPITILDESFGALDPVTLKEVMETARSWNTALVVIAHP